MTHQGGLADLEASATAADPSFCSLLNFEGVCGFVFTCMELTVGPAKRASSYELVFTSAVVLVRSQVLRVFFLHLLHLKFT